MPACRIPHTHIPHTGTMGGGRAQEKRLGSGGERYASGTDLDSDIVLLQSVHAEQLIHAVKGREGVELVLEVEGRH
jgi:hypothetical protein